MDMALNYNKINFWVDHAMFSTPKHNTYLELQENDYTALIVQFNNWFNKSVFKVSVTDRQKNRQANK